MYCQSTVYSHRTIKLLIHLSNFLRLVRSPINANLWLNFDPGSFSLLKSIFLGIFSILFRVFDHQIIEKRIKLNLLLSCHI